MKTLTLAAIGLFASFASFCQKSPIKYGVIPMDDMIMTRYEMDTSAAAVVLVDYGESFGYTMTLERHVRIKILKKEGLRLWADVRVPASDKSKMSGLRASTYNLVGEKIVVTEMSKEGVFRENFTKGLDLITFTLPNVKEGSVLEYSYKINGSYLPNWEFQQRIPIRWCEFWAVIPDYFKFEKYMQGYLVPTTFESKNVSMTGYQALSHHWIMKDVPAFKPEPFMTSEEDYISKVNFALSHIEPPGAPVIEVMGSWKTLNDELLKHDDFGKVIVQSSFLKETAVRVTMGITDPMKQIEAVHKYVSQTMEWNGRNDIACEDLKKAVEKKSGNSAEINFMMAAMLEKLGFLVDMVILSTRDHGFVRPQFPMVEQFNYVICAARVNGKPILLDATEKDLPYTILPLRCLNEQGLIISSITPDWIDLTAKAKAKITVSADLSIMPNGDIRGKLQYTFDGYEAHKTRKEYRTSGQEEYLKKYFKDQQWQIEKTEFQNIKELSLPVKQVHEVNLQAESQNDASVIYFSPFVVSKGETNPFKAEKREFPIDFGSPVEKMFIITLKLPDGYEVDELPESSIMRLPDNSARFTYNATKAGNMVSVVSNLQIQKSLFVQTSYPDLREFYNQVVAKQAEQIVLKKK